MLRIKFILMIILLLTSCNFLSEFADKESNDAIYFDAKSYLNEGKYTESITEFEKLPASFLADNKVKYEYASAYAGRCGLEFIPFLEGLIAEANSSQLFLILMKTLTGANSSNVDDCKQAESILEAATTTAIDRTDDVNWLLTFVEFAKIGTIISSNADIDEDKTVDAGFDPCQSSDISDENVKHVITGLNIGMESMISAISGLDSELSVIATQYQQACSDLESINSSLNFCNRSDIDSVTSDEVRGMRTLINDGNVLGIGTCVSANVALCVCL